MTNRKGFLTAVALATAAIAVSCAEAPTGPPPSAEDIVGGAAFQALYIGDDDGQIKLASTATVPAVLRASAPARQVDGSLTLGMDSVRASALARRFSTVSKGATMSLDGNRHGCTCEETWAI